jgi:hypothetical protein
VSLLALHLVEGGAGAAVGGLDRKHAQVERARSLVPVRYTFARSLGQQSAHDLGALAQQRHTEIGIPRIQLAGFTQLAQALLRFSIGDQAKSLAMQALSRAACE